MSPSADHHRRRRRRFLLRKSGDFGDGFAALLVIIAIAAAVIQVCRPDGLFSEQANPVLSEQVANSSDNRPNSRIIQGFPSGLGPEIELFLILSFSLISEFRIMSYKRYVE